MRRVHLGRTDLEISSVGLGTWAAGGSGWEVALGPQDDEETKATIRRALSLGVNWIDTAPAYGLGHSERIVAEALRGAASQPLVFTKCGFRWGGDRRIVSDLSAASIRLELEESLRRLEREVVDLYQIHWPLPPEQIEEGWGTLAALKEEGKVRWLGLSNFSLEQLHLIERVAPIDVVQAGYSLLNRAVERDILPFCAAREIGVIVYSPLAIGMLGGRMSRERLARLPEDDWRRDHPEFREPRLTRNLAVAQRVRELGERHECAPGAVAVAWCLRNPAVSGAIVGCRRPEQLDLVAHVEGVDLSPGEAAELDRLTAGAEWRDEE